MTTQRRLAEEETCGGESTQTGGHERARCFLHSHTNTFSSTRSLRDDWPLASTSSGSERGDVKHRRQRERLSEGRAERRGCCGTIRYPCCSVCISMVPAGEPESNRRRIPPLCGDGFNDLMVSSLCGSWRVRPAGRNSRNPEPGGLSESCLIRSLLGVFSSF